jgi:hypothetical protein
MCRILREAYGATWRAKVAINRCVEPGTFSTVTINRSRSGQIWPLTAVGGVDSVVEPGTCSTCDVCVVQRNFGARVASISKFRNDHDERLFFSLLFDRVFDLQW